uniref:Uncharacterized protein n=1 Tax=Tetradesmus obliquus TaxID=3088 RepID=A0A383W0J9_TETOB|eukprot:jgi/Sobl393_1/3985/SZX71197.1
MALDFDSDSQFDELKTWPAGELTTVKALRWLLRQPAVTPATINQCSQQLLAIPAVPLAAAEALVRAGLRVQITGQQLVASAYEGFQRFEVVLGLSPARIADALAVALNVAAWRTSSYYRNSNHICRCRICHRWGSMGVMGERSAVCNVLDMFYLPACTVTAQLPASAVEALLRLALQLCGSGSVADTESWWFDALYRLSMLPAAAQLPTAALELTAEHVARLLPLLRVSTAAVAADAYQVLRMPGGLSVLLWLASQPAAAEAAASVGLTAADVQDSDAAALLFGGQQQAGSADGV